MGFVSQVQESAEKPEVKMEPHEIDKQKKEQRVPKVVILQAQNLSPEPVNISVLPAVACFLSIMFYLSDLPKLLIYNLIYLQQTSCNLWKCGRNKGSNFHQSGLGIQQQRSRQLTYPGHTLQENRTFSWSDALSTPTGHCTGLVDEGFFAMRDCQIICHMLSLLSEAMPSQI